MYRNQHVKYAATFLLASSLMLTATPMAVASAQTANSTQVAASTTKQKETKASTTAATSSAKPSKETSTAKEKPAPSTNSGTYVPGEIVPATEQEQQLMDAVEKAIKSGIDVKQEDTVQKDVSKYDIAKEVEALKQDYISQTGTITKATEDWEKAKKDYSEQKAKYEENLARYQKAKAVYEKDLATFNEYRKKYDKEVAEVDQREVTNKTVAYDTYVASLERYEAEKETYEKKLEDFKKSQKDYETALDTYEKEKASYDAIVADYVKFEKKFQADKSNFLGKKSAYEAALKKYNTLKGQYEKDKVTYDGLKKKYDKDSAAYKKAQNKYKAAKKEYDAAKAKYDANKKKFDKDDSRYKASVADYKAKKKKYDADLSAYKTAKTKYEADTKKYEADSKKYEQSMSKYNTDMKKYKTDLEAFKAEEKKYLELKKTYDAEKTKYDKALVAYKKNLNAYNTAWKTYETDLATYTTASKNYNEALSKYKADHKAYQNAVAKYKTVVKANEAEKAKYEQALAAYKKKNQKYIADKKAYDTAVEKNKQIEASNKKVDAENERRKKAHASALAKWEAENKDYLAYQAQMDRINSATADSDMVEKWDPKDTDELFFNQNMKFNSNKENLVLDGRNSGYGRLTKPRVPADKFRIMRGGKDVTIKSCTGPLVDNQFEGARERIWETYNSKFAVACNVQQGDVIHATWLNAAKDTKTGRSLDLSIELKVRGVNGGRVNHSFQQGLGGESQDESHSEFMDRYDKKPRRKIFGRVLSYESVHMTGPRVYVYSNAIDNFALENVFDVDQKVNLRYADTRASYDKPFYLTVGSLDWAMPVGGREADDYDSRWGSHPNRVEFTRPGLGVIDTFIPKNSYLHREVRGLGLERGVVNAHFASGSAYYTSYDRKDNYPIDLWDHLDDRKESVQKIGVTYLVANGATIVNGTDYDRDHEYYREIRDTKNTFNRGYAYNHIMLTTDLVGSTTPPPKTPPKKPELKLLEKKEKQAVPPKPVEPPRPPKPTYEKVPSTPAPPTSPVVPKSPTKPTMPSPPKPTAPSKPSMPVTSPKSPDKPSSPVSPEPPVEPTSPVKPSGSPTPPTAPTAPGTVTQKSPVPPTAPTAPTSPATPTVKYPDPVAPPEPPKPIDVEPVAPTPPKVPSVTYKISALRMMNPGELKINKMLDNPKAEGYLPGEEVNFIIEVGNTGQDVLKNVRLEDVLGDDFDNASFVYTDAAGKPVESAFVNIGDLASGEIVTVKAKGTLKETGNLDNLPVNKAFATSPDDPSKGDSSKEIQINEDIPSDTDGSDLVTVPWRIIDPSIEVIKTLNADKKPELKAGNVVPYRFQVNNTSELKLRDVKLNDVKFTDEENDAIACEATVLAPKGKEGSSTTCTGAHTLTDEDVQDGEFDNTVTVTAKDPFDRPVTDEDDYTLSQPEIRLIKNVDAKSDLARKLYVAGDKVPYVFTVTNTGKVDVSDVRIEDKALDSDATCEQTDLAIGESTTCRGLHTLTEEEATQPEFINTAVAVGKDVEDGEDVVSNEDEAVVHFSDPKLKLVKDVDESSDLAKNLYIAGDKVPYVFTVTNNGKVDLHDLRIQDKALDADAKCESSDLKVGESTTCRGVHTLTQQEASQPEFVNVAFAETRDGDGRKVVSNEDDAVVKFPVTGLRLVKDIDATSPFVKEYYSAGDKVPYEFKVTNIGQVTLRDVGVADKALDAPATCDSTVLEPSASTTCRGVHTLTQEQERAGEFVNIAHATGVDPDGRIVKSNEDDEVVYSKTLGGLATTGASVAWVVFAAVLSLLVALAGIVGSRRRKLD